MKDFEAKRFGDYFLIDQIGQGGMAEVFLGATLPKEEKSLFIAIKRLFPKYSDQKSFVKRLISEAKIAAILDHPNVVSVFNVGVVGQSFYLAMEWVDGKSLDQVLTKAQTRGTPLPKPAILYLLHEVAKALDYAHSAKDRSGRDLELVHQDLTPGNILVGYDGKVKITDFGIATAERQVEKDGSQQPAFGKIPYMAPEQIRKKGISQRSDLFSLGVVAYELLSGQKPFQTTKALEMVDLPKDHPPKFEHSTFQDDPSLKALLESHLSPDPANRPPSARIWLEFIPETDLNIGKSLLVAWLAECFGQEQKIEKERRNLGIHQLAIEKSRPEASAPECDEEEMIEHTQFMTKEEPGQKTRVAFKNPSITKGIARVDLKKAISHRKVKVPKPVEEMPLNPELSNPRIHRLPPPHLEEDDPPEGLEMEDETQTSPEWKKARTHSDEDSAHSQEKDQEEMVLTTNENLFHEVHSEPSAQSPSPEASKPETKKRETISTPPKEAPRPPSTPSHRPRVIPQESLWRKIPLPNPGVAAALVSISAIVILALLLINLRSSIMVRVPLIPMRRIAIHFVFETPMGKEAPKEDLGWRNPRTLKSVWKTPLQRFFNREYKRYGGEMPFPFALEFQPLHSGMPEMNWRGDFFHPYAPFETLSSAFQLPLELKNAYSGRVFILAYPKEPTESARYPIDFDGSRTPGQGVFFLPLDRFQIEKTKIRLAHEIAHVAGATDKFSRDLHPDFPEGYFDPERKPLYPQDFADISAPMIPTSENEIRPPRTLDEVGIGRATALEMGWVKDQ